MFQLRLSKSTAEFDITDVNDFVFARATEDGEETAAPAGVYVRFFFFCCVCVIVNCPVELRYPWYTVRLRHSTQAAVMRAA